MLAACTHGNFSQNSYDCTINNVDHLKYSNDFNKELFKLKIPKELDITLPSIDLQYDIPPINSIKNYNSQGENEVNINIYPPTIFKDIFNESCLIDFD